MLLGLPSQVQHLSVSLPEGGGHPTLSCCPSAFASSISQSPHAISSGGGGGEVPTLLGVRPSQTRSPNTCTSFREMALFLSDCKWNTCSMQKLIWKCTHRKTLSNGTCPEWETVNRLKNKNKKDRGLVTSQCGQGSHLHKKVSCRTTHH